MRENGTSCPFGIFSSMLRQNWGVGRAILRSKRTSGELGFQEPKTTQMPAKPTKPKSASSEGLKDWPQIRLKMTTKLGNTPKGQRVPFSCGHTVIEVEKYHDTPPISVTMLLQSLPSSWLEVACTLSILCSGPRLHHNVQMQNHKGQGSLEHLQGMCAQPSSPSQRWGKVRSG